jgi:hypothetical protein
VKIECDASFFHDAFRDAFEDYFKSKRFDPPWEFYEAIAPSISKKLQEILDSDTRPEWINEIMKAGLLHLENFLIENEVFDKISELESRIERLESLKK